MNSKHARKPGRSMTPEQTEQRIGETWIEPEDWCYNTNYRRRAFVRITQNPHNPIRLPYGKCRIVRARIPDTFFTIPAWLRFRRTSVRGYISQGAGELTFTPEADPPQCSVCKTGEGCHQGEKEHDATRLYPLRPNSRA